MRTNQIFLAKRLSISISLAISSILTLNYAVNANPNLVRSDLDNRVDIQKLYCKQTSNTVNKTCLVKQENLLIKPGMSIDVPVKTLKPRYSKSGDLIIDIINIDFSGKKSKSGAPLK